MNGLCLVISPLIALMKDQVENLRRRNITAFAIYSGMTRKEVVHTLQIAAGSNCKFLYLSPERLQTKLFLEYLPALGVGMIAIDEAHCISQWGYDFRPPYLKIAELRAELPGVPMLALTASATPLVQQDICDKLQLQSPSIFRQSFARPNLSYSVFEEPSKINRIIRILEKVGGTGIVYCRSRKKTREVADLLKLHGISADYYHAGLTSEERTIRQEAWIKGKIRVIVCTNAFGMGIDKPDVRTVIHIDVPDCLENYYQEAGRAGRDGNKSYAVLLYNQEDLSDLRDGIDTKFPAETEIRSVYQALVNHLQLPEGSGEGMYFDFDLFEFIRINKFQSAIAISSIKAIEQEGILGYSEQVFIQSRVQFICSRNYLQDFEQSNTAIEPLIKTLLRSYEGIYDQPVNISEKYIASVLRKEVSAVIHDLKVLDGAAVIEYEPQKDKPQLFFLRNRSRVADLSLNMSYFNERKKLYEQRMQDMINFVKEKDECRSKIIGKYFGDDSINNCGICDNCLAKKKKPLSDKEFASIHAAIEEQLKEGPINTEQLYSQLAHIRRQKLSEVLRFLQTENKIVLNNKGQLTRS